MNEYVNRTDAVIKGVRLMNGNEIDGKLRGDCDPNLLSKFMAYTPVPGGVGPMTIASLMVNVVK